MLLLYPNRLLLGVPPFHMPLSLFLSQPMPHPFFRFSLVGPCLIIACAIPQSAHASSFLCFSLVGPCFIALVLNQPMPNHCLRFFSVSPCLIIACAFLQSAHASLPTLLALFLSRPMPNCACSQSAHHYLTSLSRPMASTLTLFLSQPMVINICISLFSSVSPRLILSCAFP